MKTISVVGLGYIGLPTAILAAQVGYKVFGFDINQDKVEKINSGDPTILEPEISPRLLQVIGNKNFIATTNLEQADCFIIAVPTPFFVENYFDESKKADLSYVFQAGEQVAQKIKKGDLVILESTVPVGTTFKLAQFLQEKSGLKLGEDFFVAHCPERVLPGKIFKELVINDRVIGGICENSNKLAEKFYSKFVKGTLYLTDDKSAEMVKLIENASRDVQIAFANQVAGMCQGVGIDAYKVIELANKHPRVKILSPSCGVGGHCIAVDPWFLIQSFPKDTNLLRMARNINDQKPSKVLQDVNKQVEQLKLSGISKPRLLILGLTFKADVDDMRESPALAIAKNLNSKKDFVELSICEPNVKQNVLVKEGFSNLVDFENGVDWADLILILVKHEQFFTLENLNLKNKFIIDTCGLLHAIEMLRVSNTVKITEKIISRFTNV